MRPGYAECEAALDETVKILQRWAREGHTDGWYKSLSEVLKADGHRAHHRGSIISHLLADACRRDSHGHQPMLFAL